MAEVFESKLQLAKKKKVDGQVLPEVNPGLLSQVVSPEVPPKVLYRTVLLLEATELPTQVQQRLGLTAGCISSPFGGWEARLLQALHVRESQ